MSGIDSIKFKEDGIYLTLRISKEEYEFLRQATSDLLVIPTDSKSLDKPLTTGKLGNSSRLMLPKKVLDGLEVGTIEKKVPGKVFMVGGSTYILARLHQNKGRKSS